MFFIAASLCAVACKGSKHKGGAKGLKFGKLFAHLMRTGNKMLFCSPRIKIPAYHQPPAVCRSSLALPFVLVQELVFAGCFFRFAPYGRALVWAQCGCMPHKPKGTDQTAKGGKMLPVKCERGTKCYFVPRALKSQLTTSCY